MNLLVADDDPFTRLTLEELLRGWGYGVEVAPDGLLACAALCRPSGPRLAILDWEMPGLDGPEVCRRVRQTPTAQPPYLIMLTCHDRPEDLATGLRSGANDYLTKPFHEVELSARLGVALRTLELQRTLAERVTELEEALTQVRQLRGLLPICAWCKKVRDGEDYWHRVEEYLAQHSDMRFTHAICPDCSASMMREARGRK